MKPSLLILGLLLLVPHPARAQQFRLRWDTRIQSVAFRGVQIDSVPAGDVVTDADGATFTADGYAVDCDPGSATCTFFRPGPVLRGAPVVTTASATVWGLGVTGLRLRTTARFGFDARDEDAWPGTDPGAELVEGFAEWARPSLTLAAGRLSDASRFGFVSFDGGRADVRPLGGRVRGSVWGGWGLARASAFPVTDPVNDPFDEFLPERRQQLLGADVEGGSRLGQLRVLYLREVDPRARDFVSERAGVEAVARRFGLRVAGGADYDLAAGWWGSAEGSVAYEGRADLGTLELGARRYRPHFALWTIWGAFSPVPFRAAFATASARPHGDLLVRFRGEVYEYDETGAVAPLVITEDSGWRWRADATYPARGPVRAGLGWQREFGPGASSTGWQGSMDVDVRDGLQASAFGGQWLRPLELRYDDAKIWTYGAGLDWDASEGVRVSAQARRFEEERERPDAASFDWDQWRLSLAVTIVTGSGSPRLPEPITRIPVRSVP
jgi:hypothetical protein